MRARNINGRRDDPNASFISQVLGYPETPHGLIPRSFIADILREGVEELHGLASFHVPIVVRVRALADESRWDEKAGLRRDAVRSQVIDALEAQEIKETGNEEG